jgi:hypothetical protein
MKKKNPFYSDMKPCATKRQVTTQQNKKIK